MAHPIVFLIGLHGTGKSTLGRHLTRAHEWSHLSIGDIARHVRNGERPSDISLRLIVELSTHRSGERLGDRLVESILFEVGKHSIFKPVVCDGFPAHLDHLELIPANATVILLSCSEGVRAARLDNRALVTARKWTPGNPSERDNQLPLVVAALPGVAEKRNYQFRQIKNDANGVESLKALASSLIERKALAF